MHNIHEAAVYIISFVVLIAVMVVVHEFGHFAVAKLCRVRVEAFSIGFGPRLFGVKRGDTDYKVCLLPLGGYVKMTGENPTEGDQAVDDPGAFSAHPRWQRMLIGVAGPVANFILAFVLMFIYFHWINEVPQNVVSRAVIEWVVPGSPAAQAGLETGDVITHFETVDNPDWSQVYNRAPLNLNQTVPVTVERDGKTIPLSLHIPPLPKGHDFVFTDVGFLPQIALGPIGVEDVQAGTPAAKVGLRDGDQIESVDGHKFHFVGTLLAYMQSGQGKPITLDVLRNGSHVTMVVTPAKLDSDWKLGFVAASVPEHMDPQPVGQAAHLAKAFCRDNSFLIVEVLGKLFTHKVEVSQLSGPIGIARMAGDAYKMKDFKSKFGLAAGISLNLGILNLLPFPILDGGLILLLLIESVLRHDISLNVKERIYQGAFVVLVVFFAFIMFNDVTKLPIFMHAKP